MSRRVQAARKAAPERRARGKGDQGADLRPQQPDRLDRRLRIRNADVDVEAEDQLPAGGILHLLDDPLVAGPVRDQLVLVAGKRVRPGRGEHEPLLADGRLEVRREAAAAPPLRRRWSRRPASGLRSPTGTARSSCGRRTRRRGRRRGSCPPAGQDRTSPRRAACTPPRRRACRDRTSRSGADSTLDRRDDIRQLLSPSR